MEYIYIVSLFTSICVIIFSCFLVRSLIVLNRFKTFPGPGPRLPIIGNLLTFCRPGVPLHKLLNIVFDELEVRYKKEGIAVMCYGSKAVVYILKAKYAAKFFQCNNVIDKPSEYNILKHWIGSTLFTANGLLWKNKRKQFNYSFHSKILESYETEMNEECSKLISKLHDLSNQSFIDIRPIFLETTFNIIGRTLMGLKSDQNIDDLNEYALRLQRIVSSFVTRLYNPLNWYDFIFYRRNIGKQVKHDMQFIDHFAKNIINKRKFNYKPEEHLSKSKQMDFLDLILKLQVDDKSITDKQIRNEVIVFLSAGFETSLTCISWTLLLLGNHIECQLKLIQEIKAIFGDDTERHVNKDDLNRMHYTECVLKESLRLYPPSVVLGRVANTDVEIGGYLIPKGTSVFANVLHVQTDEEIFSNPLEFYPERFQNQTEIQLGFAAFALGARNCIGQRFAMMELKIMLAQIFRNFTIKSLEKESDVELSFVGSTKSVNPIRIAFNPSK